MVALVDQAVASTAVPASQLSVSVNASPSGNGLVYLVVFGGVAAGISSSPALNWQRRVTLPGPVSADLWAAQVPFAAQPVQVTVNVLAAPAQWGIGVYSFSSWLPNGFDPGNPLVPAVGGGPAALVPYRSTANGDLLLAVVLNDSGAMEMTPGWIPLLGVQGSTLVGAAFMLALGPPQPGVFVAQLSSPVTWTATVDALLTIPMGPAPVSPAGCMPGSSARIAMDLPPAPPPAAAPPAPAPATNYHPCIQKSFGPGTAEGGSA